jgi:hypothetical protein
MGRWLIGAGILLLVAGIVVILGERVGIRLGRLPGDIRVEGKHGAFYFPLTTCLVVSVVVSVLSWLFRSR